MMPQKLKNSILQLAVQGKLVPQDPFEGTGEELYKQIQAEKARLIELKLIKDDKKLTDPEEPPFEIPDSWKWARITDCGSFISGYTPKPDQLVNHGDIPYFKVADMNTKGNELFMSITRCYLSDKAPQKYFLKNTIVYPKNGGAVFTNKKRILSQDSVVDLNTGGFSVIGPVYLMYYYYFFSLIDFRQCYKGTALPTIDMEKLKKKWVPLPPLAEQKRIVAKIEELLPLIDRYEQAWSKLEAFNKRFSDDMQKSLLQFTMQGKLVDQRPEEGTGEGLYKQIQKEKTKRIKEGALKKTKPLPDITDDLFPYNIPETWKKCYIDDLAFVTKLAGFEYTKYVAPNLALTGIPLFKGKNVQNGRIVLSFESYIPENVSDELPRSQIRKKCLLTPYVGTIGNIAIFDGSFRAHLGSNVGKIELLNGDEQYVLEEYVLYYLRSSAGYAELTKYKKATAQESISIEAIRNVIIPLPPLVEQKRIVAKLKELLPLCGRLKQ